MSTTDFSQPDQSIPGLSSATAQRLCAWLNTLDGTRHDARPVFMHIGRTVYGSGAQYTDHVGDTVIYILGRVPTSYQRRALYCISKTQADDRLWYVSGYFPGRSTDMEVERFVLAHPFGPMFMLRRSQVPVKIDKLDWKTRVEHNWLTQGARGGDRPIMNITRIWLDKDKPIDAATDRLCHCIEDDCPRRHPTPTGLLDYPEPEHDRADIIRRELAEETRS